MERRNAWKTYTDEELADLERLSRRYIDFISENKTERECAATAIKLAEDAGYRPLSEIVEMGETISSGDKIWAHTRGKALVLVHVGSEPISKGMNILGAHIDSPRLDLKQNPLYESSDLAFLDTHYYGGIKKYQWVTVPLAIHGMVVKTDGTLVPVVVGEDPDDPVFCVTDLLPHLGAEQMRKNAAKVVEGEVLDVLIGGRPLVIEGDGESDGAGDSGDGDDTEGDSGERAATTESGSGGADAADVSGDDVAGSDSDTNDDAPEWVKVAKKEPVKAMALKLLWEKYGIREEDFLSAELEVVPAGRARELGFDRSMVIGYGQDDRVCAYASLVAQLEIDAPARTAVTILIDKEEIGSVGATGMESMFFENTIAEIMELAGEGGMLPLRRALSRSRMLSSDVSAGFDPAYASVFESKNSAYLGRGLVFNKYTGSRGKSGSNDASAEYMALVRKIMDDADVAFQTAELGKVDAGGGGTIAFIPAKYDMDVIDSGVAVLSMHAPWEITSKADIYEARKGYSAFLLDDSCVERPVGLLAE